MKGDALAMDSLVVDSLHLEVEQKLRTQAILKADSLRKVDSVKQAALKRVHEISK